MGLFDRFKKKTQQNTSSYTPGDEYYWRTTANAELSRDITQAVAMFMYQVGITKEPGLSFFHNDRDIFEGLFVQHTTNADLLALKAQPDDVYMRICGMHAFGAGAYVTAKQLDFGRPVDQFTINDIQSIAQDFYHTDAYELALNRLGIPLQSRNKMVIDQIIVTALDTVKTQCGTRRTNPENLKAYMQVLFNAGISMYMLRKTE